MKRIIVQSLGYLFSFYLLVFVWLTHTKIFVFDSPWITFFEGMVGFILLCIGTKIVVLSIEELVGSGRSIVKDLELMGGLFSLLGALYIVTAILFAILGGIFGIIATPRLLPGISLFIFYLILGVVLLVSGISMVVEAYKERDEEENFYFYN